jgi:hypothetical protein
MAATIFGIVYFVAVVGAGVFALHLLWRLVRAHERVANSLEEISRRTPQ